jgi:hypothetical protein
LIELWDSYTKGKQTYSQLASTYSCSIRTIQRNLDKHQIVEDEKIISPVIVLMDTTYWGRNFGVMLFKDAITKQNLLKYYVKTETNSLYVKGIDELKGRGSDTGNCLRW